MNNIKESIRRLAQGGRTTTSLVCVVDAVDEKARTIDCTPLDESAPLPGVNLQANQGSAFGLVVFPTVGSYVVVGFVAEGSAGVVLLTDEIARIEVVVDDARVEISPDGIVMNGGELGGLVKIDELKNNLDQLKRYVEQLKNAINTGLNSVGMGTSASGSAGATAFNAAMGGASINYVDMENEKVKQ